ncbi:hypothetical protein M231_05387 [Tremella mesenterica]|uniref:Uncharacterized protein n=1 Tax=Tremella mesenterica TaxID=5217 RepID=A0A4Q1BI58_TREME|nr:hypothetical protein M231_05387 [Tremella mesenterica]
MPSEKDDCPNAVERSFPTLIWQYEIDQEGVLTPGECWSCHTNFDEDCSVTSLRLCRKDDHLPGCKRDISLILPNHTSTKTGSRTATEAGLTEPEAKRPTSTCQTPPPTCRQPIPPLPSSSPEISFMSRIRPYLPPLKSLGYPRIPANNRASGFRQPAIDVSSPSPRLSVIEISSPFQSTHVIDVSSPSPPSSPITCSKSQTLPTKVVQTITPEYPSFDLAGLARYRAVFESIQSDGTLVLEHLVGHCQRVITEAQKDRESLQKCQEQARKEREEHATAIRLCDTRMAHAVQLTARQDQGLAEGFRRVRELELEQAANQKLLKQAERDRQAAFQERDKATRREAEQQDKVHRGKVVEGTLIHKINELEACRKKEYADHKKTLAQIGNLSAKLEKAKDMVRGIQMMANE